MGFLTGRSRHGLSYLQEQTQAFLQIGVDTGFLTDRSRHGLSYWCTSTMYMQTWVFLLLGVDKGFLTGRCRQNIMEVVSKSVVLVVVDKCYHKDKSCRVLSYWQMQACITLLADVRVGRLTPSFLLFWLFLRYPTSDKEVQSCTGLIHWLSKAVDLYLGYFFLAMSI